MPAKPGTIDEYLARLSGDKRAALENLRKQIKSAAPKAEECISYEIPTFKIDGRMLLSFAAWANHCALYAGVSPIKSHKTELKGYDTSKGTIRFKAASPLPVTLVRKLVKSRIAERTARRP